MFVKNKKEARRLKEVLFYTRLRSRKMKDSWRMKKDVKDKD